MNTETVTSTETVSESVSTGKRAYASRDEMQRGQQAILAVLRRDGEGMTKAEVFAALSEADRVLVERNWNLRIAKLEAGGFVVSRGRKAAKRYLKAAAA